MAQKFLTLVDGIKRLVEAITSSSGSADAGKIPALSENGRFSESFMPPGIGAQVKTLQCTEDLAAGKNVNFYENAGVWYARLADCNAPSPRPADGFVRETFASGSTATVYVEGLNDQLGSLVPGMYFLGTAGATSSTPPSSSGSISQTLGRATDADELKFNPSDPITLA